MAWLSNNNLPATDPLHADQLNSLANDIRNWGGDVNGGGHFLSNVIIVGYDPGGPGSWMIGPLQVFPAPNSNSSIVFGADVGTGNYPPRWEVGKNQDPETGTPPNSGSNFAITRYNDAGNVINTPIYIDRASGSITLTGNQQWTGGNIDGGGATLYNVIIPSALQDPTTAKGDLIVRGAPSPALVTRLGVGTNGQVLTADSTQTLGLKWATPTGAVSSVFTRTGAVVAVAGDYTAAQVTNAVDSTQVYANPAWISSLAYSKITGVPPTVPTTRQIIAGTGLTGGGDLSADRTLSVVADTVNQRVQVLNSGAVVGTQPRHAINFIPGANVTLTITENTASNWYDVIIAGQAAGGGGMSDPTTTLGDLIVRGPGGTTRIGVGANGQVLTADSTQTLGVKWATPAAGGSQTPWLQDVDAATHALNNVGAINGIADVTIVGATKATAAVRRFVVESNDSVNQLLGYLALQTDPTAGNRRLALDCLENSVAWRNVTMCEGGGFVGIRNANPAYALDVAGDVNITGTYRVNGVPLATGSQTPWLQNVDANYFTLTHARQVTLSADADGLVTNFGIAQLQVSGRTNAQKTLWIGFDTLNNVGAIQAGVATVSWNSLVLNPAGGNVGIGLTAPLSPLSFAPAVGNKINLFDNSTQMCGFAVQANQLQFIVQSAAVDMVFGTGTTTGLTELFRIKGTGNVGIGTGSPPERLTVAGAVKVAGAISAYGSSSGSFDFEPTAYNTRLWSFGPDTSTMGGFQFIQSHSDGTGVIALSIYNGNIGLAGVTNPSTRLTFPAVAGDKICLYDGQPFGFGIQTSLLQMMSGPGSDIAFGIGQSASFTEHVRFQYNGAVGIGTSTPQAQLDVFGAGQATNTPTTGGNQGGTVLCVDTTGSVNSGGMVLFGCPQGTFAGIKGLLQNGGGNTGGDLVLLTRRLATDGVLTPAIYIQSTGKVAIGNFSPSYALDVQGDVNITGAYRVNGTPISAGGGGITTQTSPPKQPNQTYQNQTAKPVFVAVVFTVISGAIIQAYCDSGASPTTAVSGASAGGTYVSVCFWVLPNYFYKVNTSGSATLTQWVEWT